MSSPKVSVIIPAYNGAEYIAETIRSVLDQTYPNLEIVIVDDASTDHTPQVIGQFADPRLKYIRHEKNQGPNRTRVTAISASSGEIIAWLDQDDLFHPQKLEAHVTFLAEHPDVGMSYNARFDLDNSSKTIRDLWRPPRTLSLSDLVLGFPIAPSEMVFTRDWGGRLDLWEGNWGISGGEIILTSRLLLSGCTFGCVDRALNYRRYYSGRILKNLSGRCESELECQETVFADPRCPPKVLELRNIAFMNTYLTFGLHAFAQSETKLGQEYFRKGSQLNPSILEGKPPPLMDSMIEFSVADENENHEALLRSIFCQLPPEMTQLSAQYDWAVARGYQIKGARAIMWDRPEDGRVHFARAAELKAEIDESFVRRLTYQVLNYEKDFGTEAAQEVLRNWAPYLEKVGNRRSMRRLRGNYLINQAFRCYQAGKYAEVPQSVMHAIANDPRYLANRGVMSILFRSTLGMRPRRANALG